MAKRRTTPEEDKESIRKQIASLTNEIKEERSDFNLIGDIEKRSGLLEKKINELERSRERKETER